MGGGDRSKVRRKNDRVKNKKARHSRQAQAAASAPTTGDASDR